jgi:hypothetical protein
VKAFDLLSIMVAAWVFHAATSPAATLEPEPSQPTVPVEGGIPASAQSAAKSRSEEETLGSMIGRYELLEKIGEGGFGVVYVAEQREPVKRRVALKIIKLGMDTRQIVARFEVERQALAMMDHPNIAKVFDGGTAVTLSNSVARSSPPMFWCNLQAPLADSSRFVVNQKRSLAIDSLPLKLISILCQSGK